MLQIPEGLQMGNLYAAGEHAIPAGIEFIFVTSVLPIFHPYGALAVHSMWAFNPSHVCCAAIAYIHFLLSLFL